MKTTLLFTAIVMAFVACSPAKDKVAIAALDNYKHFVDSIYSQNEVWKKNSDTIYTESASDPSHPNEIHIDTIIIPPGSKKNLVLDEFWGKGNKSRYEALTLVVESNTAKMDDGMKKEYEAYKQKFESIESK